MVDCWPKLNGRYLCHTETQQFTSVALENSSLIYIGGTLYRPDETLPPLLSILKFDKKNILHSQGGF